MTTATSTSSPLVPFTVIENSELSTLTDIGTCAKESKSFEILNTNAKYLSEELSILGLNVFYQTTVGDNPERLKKMGESAKSLAVYDANERIYNTLMKLYTNI